MRTDRNSNRPLVLALSAGLGAALLLVAVMLTQAVERSQAFL